MPVPLQSQKLLRLVNTELQNFNLTDDQVSRLTYTEEGRAMTDMIVTWLKKGPSTQERELVRDIEDNRPRSILELQQIIAARIAECDIAQEKAKHLRGRGPSPDRRSTSINYLRTQPGSATASPEKDSPTHRRGNSRSRSPEKKFIPKRPRSASPELRGRSATPPRNRRSSIGTHYGPQRDTERVSDRKYCHQCGKRHGKRCAFDDEDHPDCNRETDSQGKLIRFPESTTGNRLRLCEPPLNSIPFGFKLKRTGDNKWKVEPTTQGPKPVITRRDRTSRN